MCLPEERVAASSRKSSSHSVKESEREGEREAFADSGHSVTVDEGKESECEGEDKQASD